MLTGRQMREILSPPVWVVTADAVQLFGVLYRKGQTPIYTGPPVSGIRPINALAKRMASYPYWPDQRTTVNAASSDVPWGVWLPARLPEWKWSIVLPADAERAGMPLYKWDAEEAGYDFVGSGCIRWPGWPTDPHLKPRSNGADVVLDYWRQNAHHPMLPAGPYCYAGERLWLPELPAVVDLPRQSFHEYDHGPRWRQCTPTLHRKPKPQPYHPFRFSTRSR